MTIFRQKQVTERLAADLKLRELTFGYYGLSESRSEEEMAATRGFRNLAQTFLFRKHRHFSIQTWVVATFDPALDQ